MKLLKFNKTQSQCPLSGDRIMREKINSTQSLNAEVNFHLINNRFAEK